MITRFTEVQMIPKGGSIPVKNLAEDVDVVRKLNKLDYVQYEVDEKKRIIKRLN